MNFAIVWLSLLHAASPDCSIDVPAGDPVAAGLLYSAEGFRYLRADTREDAERAVACLRKARTRLPRSAVVERDLATAWVRLERWTLADAAIARARALGAAGPELELLAAVVAARRGDPETALAAARAEGSWRADLLATQLGSSASKERLLALLPEQTRRATLGRLVLAMAESRAGDLPSARMLAQDAERQADELGLSSLVLSARRLESYFMRETSGWQGRLRLRSALEYPTNPGFATTGDVPREPPFRLALTVEGGASRSFGRLVAFGALRVDQHVFVNQREQLGELDIFQWSVAAGLRYPLSADPQGTVIGLVARVRDVYGDLFGEHIGIALEGGPELLFRLGGNLRARLALYGLKTDFIDRSPPAGVLSAVDRDRVGQRVLASFRYRSERLEAVWDAMFLRDQAQGEAFDAVGGGLGARVNARATPGLWLNAELTGTLREYGPVGDAAVIGDAATRTEFRMLFGLGARWALTERLYAVLEDVLVVTAARDRHRYADNVLSLGLEVQW